MLAFSATCQWIPWQDVVVFQHCPNRHWPIWLHLRWLPANHSPVTVMVMAMWLRLIKLGFVSPNSFSSLGHLGTNNPRSFSWPGASYFTVCWYQVMVSATGFEPVTQWLKVTCSTNWATRPNLKTVTGHITHVMASVSITPTPYRDVSILCKP